MTYVLDNTTLFVGVDEGAGPDLSAAVGVCGSCKTVVCGDITELGALELYVPEVCPKCGTTFAAVLWRR